VEVDGELGSTRCLRRGAVQLFLQDLPHFGWVFYASKPFSDVAVDRETYFCSILRIPCIVIRDFSRATAELPSGGACTSPVTLAVMLAECNGAAWG